MADIDPHGGEFESLPSVGTADADAFEAVVAAGEPTIVTGMFDAWPALAAGRQAPATLNAYLRQFDRGALVPVMEAPARQRGHFAYGPDLREFTFTKRQAPLAPTLNRIEDLIGRAEAPTVAIQMLDLGETMPGLVEQNPMPALPGIAPRLWLGGAVHTRTHNDRDHNLACVIAGHRRFVLFPPEQVSNLYVGPADNPPPLSLVDPEHPDFERFPRYRQALAVARTAVLAPGDALFVPRYWWHHVISLDPFNAMLNYWWGDAVDDPHQAFLAAILAFRDLPAGERRYWQEMIAAHVFADRGDVVSHLPASLRRPLGPMTPAQRAELRRRLSSQFMKTPPK